MSRRLTTYLAALLFAGAAYGQGEALRFTVLDASGNPVLDYEAPDVGVTDALGTQAADHEARLAALEGAPIPPAIQAALDALVFDVAGLQAQIVTLGGDIATLQANVTTLQNENTAQAVTIADHEARIAALEGGAVTLPPELARLTECFWASPGPLPADPPAQCHGRGDVIFTIDPASPWPPQ